MLNLLISSAALLAPTSALCHIATIAVIGNMHVELSTVRDTPAGPHRALLDSDGDALVTVAHMNKAVDRLQDTLGSRLTAVERENSELKALVKTLAVNQTDPEHSGPAHSDGNALDEAQMDLRRSTRETQRFQNTTFDYIQLQLRTLKQQDD